MEKRTVKTKVKRVPAKSRPALLNMLDVVPYAFDENEHGEIVALNRRYKPIYHRRSDGTVIVRPEGSESGFVDYGIRGDVQQHHVYSDKWHRTIDRNAQRILLAIAEAWMLAAASGLPIPRAALVPSWAVGSALARPIPEDAGLAKMPWWP